MNTIDSQLPVLPNPLWLNKEKQITKISKIVGIAFLALGVISLAAMDGFPALVSIILPPFLVIAALGITCCAAYYFYIKKVQSIKKTVSTQALEILSKNKGNISEEVKNQLKKLTVHIEEIEIDGSLWMKEEITDPADSSKKTTQKFYYSEATLFLKNVAFLFPQVKSIKLQHIPYANFSSLASLPLESLSVFDSEISDLDLSKFSENKNLKKLSLVACDDITEESLKIFDKNRIEELTIDNCRLKKLESDSEIKRHLYDLMEEEKQRYHEALEKIKKDFSDEKLKTELNKAHKKHTIQVNTIKSESVDKALEYKGITYDFLTHWKHLKKLTLSHLNDETLLNIAQIPTLQNFGITYSSNFTGKYFEILKTKKLAHLTIGKCGNFDFSHIKNLSEMPSLMTLTFSRKPKHLSKEDYSSNFKELKQWFRAPEKGEIKFTGVWQKK